MTAATHIAPQSGPPEETCTEAVAQVSGLAREDPAVAARYARGERGLPRLEPAVQKRCGGSFAALLAPAPRAARATSHQAGETVKRAGGRGGE